jgi:hypothetical protein
MRESLLIAAVLLSLGPLEAHAGFLYVSTAGSDSNPCSMVLPCRTIGKAETVASSGDVINIAGGTYTENVTIDISRALTFTGGWDNSFGTQDPASTPTILKGAGQQVFRILADGGVTNTTTLDRLTFMGTESAGDLGGAVFAHALNGGSLTLMLTNVAMKSNRNDAGGGALGLKKGAGSTLDVTIGDSVFMGNKTDMDGGAIAVEAANGGLALDVSDTLFRGNRARKGGAIRLSGNGGLTVAGSTFASNTATFGAGGLDWNNTGGGDLTLDVSDSTFKSNKGVFGGAVKLGLNGGGTADLMIMGSDFTSNTSTSGSAAIDVWAVPGNVMLDVSDTDFSKNKGATAGAVQAQAVKGSPPNDGTVDLILSGGKFFKNSSKGSGGGLNLSADTLDAELTNCLFVGNSAGTTAPMSGGGIRASATSSVDWQSRNCTLTRNKATGNGGGIHLAGPHTMSVVNDASFVNDIMWGNTAGGSGQDLSVDSGLVAASSFSDIGNASSTGGATHTPDGSNKNVDPKFVNAAGGNVHLKAESTLIDTGTCATSGLPVPTTDFEGTPRPTGGGCDIGADEFSP